MKNVTPQGQLSWLDMLEEKPEHDEDDLNYTDKDFVPSAQFSHMPEYIVVGYNGWADGDDSPEALERLAEVMLGDGRTFKDNKKDIYKYYGVTVAIINKKVWVAYQFDKKLVRYIPHPSETPDEDE